MVLGFLYDPQDDASFIIKKFKEIKKNFHLVYKKKKFLIEGDFEKFFKSKDIIKEKIKIDKKIKITEDNADKFSWYFKSNDKFRFHIIPILGFAFRCYSFDIEGFDAVISFEKNGKIEYLTREYQAAGQFGPKQSSAAATKLMNHLILTDKNFQDVSTNHF